MWANFFLSQGVYHILFVSSKFKVFWVFSNILRTLLKTLYNMHNVCLSRHTIQIKKSTYKPKIHIKIVFVTNKAQYLEYNITSYARDIGIPKIMFSSSAFTIYIITTKQLTTHLWCCSFYKRRKYKLTHMTISTTFSEYIFINGLLLITLW